MAQEFDPHYTWLGIPPSERPADHYRLLGIPRFESNPDVISNAADARMAFIRTFQSGPKGKFSQQILNELAAARTTLLNEPRKAAYDQDLKAVAAAVLPVAAAVPLPAKPVIPTAKPIVAEPLPAIVTTPVIAARKPVRKQGVSLPLVIAGIAVPVVLLGLVVGYLITRGKNEPQAVKPIPPPDPPTKNVSNPDPQPEKALRTNPPEKIPDKPQTPVVEKPSTVEKPSVVPVSSPNQGVDLLKLVETPRDVPLGQVVRQNDILSIRRRGGFTCAVVPFDLPATYELELLVTPREGEGLLIGLPIGGKRCMLTVDGFLNEPPNKQTRTALETIDNRRPQDTGYQGEPYFGKLLTPGQESRLTIRVSSNSLTLSCDDKEVLNWSGEPSRLGIYGLFNQGGPKRMFVGSWAAQYDISRLTLKTEDIPSSQPESTPDSKSGLNLLTEVQLPRDLVQGKASRTNEAVSLQSPDGGGFSCVRLPVQPPENYQLDLRVTSRDAKDGFMVGLSVGGRPCLLGFDGYRQNGTPRTGLEAIDGKRPYEIGFSGPVYRGPLLKDGVESALSIQVVGGTVRVECDNQEVLTWKGNPKQLSIAPIFGQHKARTLFVASWNANYDVNSLTLKPLSGPAIASSSPVRNTPSTSNSPDTPMTDSRPWRWARFNDGAGLALVPDKKRAIVFQAGRAPWKIMPIEVATGELAKGLEGQGSLESLQAFAAGPELVAFSSMENSGIVSLVKSLSGERKRERQFTKQPSDMRYAFSADGKYLAASAGLRVNLINADSGRNLGNIDPPADIRVGFVERMLDDEGTLLVLYTAKKSGGSANHRAVAYDWKSKRPKRSRDFTTRDGNLRGLHFQDDELWIWGSDFQRGAVTSYPAAGQSEQRLRVSSLQTVVDVHIPSQMALVIDANMPRLIFRTLAAAGKQTQLEYVSPLADARFVEDGKAILCLPGSPADLTLLWETAELDGRRVVAPTIKEVGLDTADRQTAAKAVQRSELNHEQAGP